MRAAFLESEGHLALVDLQKPALEKASQVLIQVKTVGVCGSEVHAFEGTHPFRRAPVILGHEMAGVVSSVGAAVTYWVPGDRVIVDPQWTCSQCAYCLAGDNNLCPSKRVLGTPEWPGAFGECIVAPEEAVRRLTERTHESPSAEVWAALGDLHRSLGDDAAAHAAYGQARELNTTNLVYEIRWRQTSGG